MGSMPRVFPDISNLYLCFMQLRQAIASKAAESKTLVFVFAILFCLDQSNAEPTERWPPQRECLDDSI